MEIKVNKEIGNYTESVFFAVNPQSDKLEEDGITAKTAFKTWKTVRYRDFFGAN